MHSFDLIIIGTGSGNSILTPDLDDWNVAIVEKGVFGGTCLNVGCIPSKMFVHAADVAEAARHADHLGVHAHVDHIDWPAIRDRVFGRIDPIAEGGERYRVEECDNVTVFRGEARFVGPKRVHVDGEILTAEHIVLAAGARPVVPDVPGAHDVAYHTSDSIMRVDEVPEHLVVVGGGYIASELSHVFGSFGSRITMVNRSETLLRFEDDEIRLAFTQASGHRFDLLLSTQLLALRSDGTTTEVDVSVDGDHRTITGDALLMAVGRIPNSDTLDVAATGVEVDHAGYVVTDSQMRTNVEGIWALGDITNPAQLKHTANAEARTVAHNLTHPDDPVTVDLSVVPHAVFGRPQVASVGLTERAARDAGLPHRCALQHYGDTAYGWAMEDTASFVKLVMDTRDRTLLGAHIIGPQASTLLQGLVLGMSFGLTVDDMARGQIYTHPALPEVIENALLQF